MVLGIARAGSLVMGETRALHGNLMSSVSPTYSISFFHILLLAFFFFAFPHPHTHPPLSPHMTIVIVVHHHRRRRRYCEKKGKKDSQKNLHYNIPLGIDSNPPHPRTGSFYRTVSTLRTSSSSGAASMPSKLLGTPRVKTTVNTAE